MHEFDSSIPTQNPSVCCRSKSQSTPFVIALLSRSATPGIGSRLTTSCECLRRPLIRLRRTVGLSLINSNIGRSTAAGTHPSFATSRAVSVQNASDRLRMSSSDWHGSSSRREHYVPFLTDRSVNYFHNQVKSRELKAKVRRQKEEQRRTRVRRLDGDGSPSMVIRSGSRLRGGSILLFSLCLLPFAFISAWYPTQITACKPTKPLSPKKR